MTENEALARLLRFWVLDAEGAPTEVDIFGFCERLIENPTAMIVANDHLTPKVSVSTVLLGLYLTRPGPTWETMIFGGAASGRQWRYTTREAAELGHLQALELARALLPKAEP